MESPSGTTEQPVVSQADLMYGKQSDADVDNAPAQTTDGTATEQSAESTDSHEITEAADKTSESSNEPGDDGANSVGEDETFLVDGEEVSLKAALDAYKGRKAAQADYTKKTQALADKNRALEEAAQTQSLQGLRALKDIETELGQLLMSDFAQVDWSAIRDTDPSQYLALKEAKESRQNAIQALKAKRDQAIAQASAAEAVKLHEALGWSDSAKRESDIKLISEGVKAASVSDAAFASLTDAGLMALVLDGIKHRQLQDKKPEIEKRVRKAPISSKPASAVNDAPLSLADRMYGKKTH